MQCPRCGRENPAEAQFCGNCGAPLSAAEPAPEPAPAAAAPQLQRVQYAGFRIRLRASVLDAIILTVAGSLLQGVLSASLGTSIASLIAFPLGWLYVVLFIGLLGQTPGKMAAGIRVVDKEGRIPGLGRATMREILGKLASGLALGLGFLWVAWDRRKRGWHDHIAGTWVVRTR